MPAIPYDLHIHSCLSPCGDDDMTVNNIVNMSLLQELRLIALTDHNSCKNCPAILHAAAGTGLAVIPGMELTTSEEIHMVCLFPELEAAMAFDRHVEQHLQPFPNDPAVFGRQLILDEGDNITSEFASLLINATDISVEEVRPLVEGFGGICWPAHIDKAANSILASIGFLPPEYGFTAVEIANPEAFLQTPAAGQAAGLRTVTSSDAHFLWQIADPVHTLPLSEPTFAALADWARGR